MCLNTKCPTPSWHWHEAYVQWATSNKGPARTAERATEGWQWRLSHYLQLCKRDDMHARLTHGWTVLRGKPTLCCAPQCWRAETRTMRNRHLVPNYVATPSKLLPTYLQQTCHNKCSKHQALAGTLCPDGQYPFSITSSNHMKEVVMSHKYGHGIRNNPRQLCIQHCSWYRNVSTMHTVSCSIGECINSSSGGPMPP